MLNIDALPRLALQDTADHVTVVVLVECEVTPGCPENGSASCSLRQCLSSALINGSGNCLGLANHSQDHWMAVLSVIMLTDEIPVAKVERRFACF